MMSTDRSCWMGLMVSCGLLFVLGCSKTEQAVADPQKWSDVPNDAVVLVVSGREYRKTEIGRYIDVQERLIDLHRKIKDERRTDARNGFLRSAALSFPLFQHLANQMPDGQVLETNAVARGWKTYWRKFGAKKQKLAEFKTELETAGLVSDVANMVETEAKVAWVLDHVYSNELAVTSAELAEVNRKIDVHLAAVAATNQLQWAAASNAWQRLERGEDFKAVADACSEDPEKEPGGDLGECTESDLASETEQFKAAIAHLAEGQHTVPVESETGIEIIKLHEVVPAVRANCAEDCWHLGRIFFRRALMLERATDEELIEELSDDKRQKFMKKTFENAVNNKEIVYPLGRQIFRLTVPRPPVSETTTNAVDTVTVERK